MTAQLLDGKALAATVRKEVAVEAARFLERTGRRPGLEVVLVGEDPASQVYVRNKERAAEKAGIRGAVHRLPASVSQSALEEKVGELNQDPTVDGILVQLPLPEGLRADPILDCIDPSKDVDGLHPMNAGLLSAGREGFQPCTPLGCMRLLKETGIALEGKHAVVVGRSHLVGKPVAQLLLKENATVTVAHSRTADLPELCRSADVLVAAVGRPQLVKGEWVRDGAVVIDVGINRREDGTLVGDVDFEAARDRAAWITPVPGGVGPTTIAMLLANTVRAAERREQ